MHNYGYFCGMFFALAWLQVVKSVGSEYYLLGVDDETALHNRL